MRNINIAVAIDTSSSNTTYISTTIHHPYLHGKNTKLQEKARWSALRIIQEAGEVGDPPGGEGVED
eukprot:scaffold1432_cov117-Skeletonema_dohrnii-CCMP3373.AAC.1